MLNKELLLAKDQKPQGKEFLLTIGGKRDTEIGAVYNTAESYGAITPRTIRFAGYDFEIKIVYATISTGVGILLAIPNQSLEASGKLTMYYKHWVRSSVFEVYKGMISIVNLDQSGDKEIFNDWNANFGKTVSVHINLE